MDVTFTNVLEGARQYFQGLPTASCSTANNSLYSAGGEHQSSHYGVEQNQERTSSATSYWPPHQETQLRTQTRDRVSVDPVQRPPSHQSDTSRPSPHNSTVNQLQEQLRTSSNYHTQTSHQEQQVVPTSHSFQFTRPHSREVQPQQHVSQQPQQQQQYQSHILPNPSYHPSSASQQTQNRTSSRMPDPSVPSSMSSQSYHQIPQQPSHTQQPQSLTQQPQTHTQQPQTHTQQPQTHTQQPQTHTQQPQTHTQQPQTHTQQPQTHSQQSQNRTQQSQNHAQPHLSQSYAGYQQSRAYYPVHSQAQQQPQSYHHSYQVASSQAYSQPQESSYVHQSYASHTQNSFTSNNNYATSKVATAHNQELNLLKENQSNLGASSQNQQTSQSYRTTHNLPPIAALSSLNYHSSRSSREVMRIASNKARTPVSTVPTTSNYPVKSVSDASITSQLSSRVPMQYSLHSSHNEYGNGVQQNRPTVSQTYQYTTSATTQANSQFSSASGNTSIPTSIIQHQSSGGHTNFQTQPTYTHFEAPKTYQPLNSKVVQQQPQMSTNQASANQSSSGVTSVMKQKRESPLDLSVKTVRTSADSTLDDADTHASDAQRLAKYYQTGRPPMHSPMQAPVSYPQYDIYANSFQRNLTAKSSQLPNIGAPKVDFLPNFNVPSLNQTPVNKVDNRRLSTQSTYDTLNQRQAYDRKNLYQQQVVTPHSSSLPRNSLVPTSAHTNSNSMLQAPSKKPLQGLPRIDFLPPTHKTSTLYAVPSNDQRKRTIEQVSSAVPNKIPKVDVWRQTIDQQIEQRLSSYAKSKFQQEQKQQSLPNKSLVNGNYATVSQERSNAYHRPQYNTLQNPQAYASSNHYSNMQTSHNQTYVPTAAAHQYPGYTNHGSQQQPALYPQHSLSRANSNPSLPVVGANRNNVGGAADRRVLSLLRNSLEIKGAKEAQKKLEQEQQKPQEQLMHHPRSDIQQPSTDVMAPLQPKPGLVGRHNMSPFAATSLFDRNSNTPPTYKFHLPKAIDSIKFDADITKDSRISDRMIHKHGDGNHTAITNPNTDLDGLAAFLAARIRTKAELKQVGPSQNLYNSTTANSNMIRSSSETQLSRPMVKQGTEFLTAHNSLNTGSSNGVSPPKLTRERIQYPPRRRLFSRNEEEINGTSTSNVPPRDKSGLRSSSETSVFDFPDSDSETEMPVLERQSLVEMRKDRKTYPKHFVSEEIEPSVPLSPPDVSFDDACDKFMEQLKSGVGKKRGRRKKIIEPDVLAKLETVVTKEKPVEGDIEIKQEIEDSVIKEDIEPEGGNDKEHDKIVDNVGVTKTESDSDSDVPLIKCKSKATTVSDTEESTDISKTKKIDGTTKSELTSDSSGESDTETIKNSSENVKVKQEKPSSGKNDPSTAKSATGKSGFGDGTDFHPGWEEEVYKYKRSLRMPAVLIHVTRPPQMHRLSTSLPDLDPCPNSPSPSENIECAKTKIKNEPADSDVDSNSNFSFSFVKNQYDSEEGSSSVRSRNASPDNRPKNSSILDRLMERCGARKRKKLKKKTEEMTPKVISKADKELELLATPSLEIPSVNSKTSKKREPIIKEESVFLGFRKKTVDNFKDKFISSPNSMIGINEQFKTVVYKSRTRMGTRVMKQKATIKEVFGEDRPASAPPVTCVDNTETQDCEEAGSTPELNVTFSKEKDAVAGSEDFKMNSVLENTKEVLKNKLLNRGRKGSANLLKSLATKKMISEYTDDDIIIKRDVDSKSETPSIDGDDYNTPARKRMKNMRRKFSSGFDYIRKKKKQVKKEGLETETTTKPKRRGLLPKTIPESEQDIQKEIKMWVMNKGIGETHLHRAARLGYTDITAYCLEKLDVSASPKDNAGYTPLHEACARGHLNIAKLLLLYGANVSESAQGGIRPLHEAAENGFVEIVRLLLSYGADPMLATYSGLTPLSLATDEATVSLLQNHIADIQGQPSAVWNFIGPAACFDLEESGYNPLEDTPNSDPVSEDEDVDFEVSDAPLPNLYTIRGEPQTDRWILLQDLSNILKIKSRDALLRQISPVTPSTSTNSNYKSVLRELKMADFLEQARCCQYMYAGEKVNTRASKIALVKYSDKVRQLLNVEKIVITAR